MPRPRLTAVRSQGLLTGDHGRTLSGIVDRAVTDETKRRPPPPGAPPPADPHAPSILAALREQLGLELDARRGMAEMLVIDRIDRPKEN